MDIENEIAETKKRVELLKRQNESFKLLLEKAHNVTKLNEKDFIQDSISVIEREKQRLQHDLYVIKEAPSFTDIQETAALIETIRQEHRKEINNLKIQLAEIKFLLLHPNTDILKSILKIEDKPGPLSETHTKLQTRVLMFEEKRAELFSAINNASIPEPIGTVINAEISESMAKLQQKGDLLSEYESVRYKMLNLEAERTRLLNDLQQFLDMSRHEIASEYDQLQQQIMHAEKQKALLDINTMESDVHATREELQSVFNAFTNIPQLEEEARVKRIEELGNVFCYNEGLPVYCNIL